MSVTEDNLLLKGSKIIIPKELQKKVITLAHEGHQGIVKTKKLLREHIWFPGIDKTVEAAIKDCIYCQAATVTNNYEPLQMSELPKSPWKEFCGRSNNSN